MLNDLKQGSPPLYNSIAIPIRGGRIYQIIKLFEKRGLLRDLTPRVVTPFTMSRPAILDEALRSGFHLAFPSTHPGAWVTEEEAVSASPQTSFT